MFTKLTLRLDESLIKKTKKLAKARNVSLSEMVAEFFKTVVSGAPGEGKTSSPVLDEISGILAGKERTVSATSYKRHVEEKYS